LEVDMDRRKFTAGAAMALLGGAAITISGCGSGAAITAATPPLTDVAGTVAANHNHSAVITAAQLQTGGALDLDIRGTAGHTHMVSLTADDVTNVRKGAALQKESSGNSHTHTVTFNG
jgi:hypothetical protein